MVLSAPKNQELIKRYPFVGEILSTNREPYDGQGENKINDLVINIEKADKALMYRRGDNVGLNDDSSFVLRSREGSVSQIMRRGEYAFAVNSENQIINQLNFPRNNEERFNVFNKDYAKQVLWISERSHDRGDGSFCKEAKYIVWLTIETWHVDTEIEGSRYGDFVERNVKVTIYQPPEHGYLKLQEESSPYVNLQLGNRLVTLGALKNDYIFNIISGILYEMCITFQDEVYFNGMRKMYIDFASRGASGQFGSVKVSVFELCGYERIMLEDTMSYISFQLLPGSKDMYVFGQQGTLPQIRALVRTVVNMWRENTESRISFRPTET